MPHRYTGECMFLIIAADMDEGSAGARKHAGGAGTQQDREQGGSPPSPGN